MSLCFVVCMWLFCDKVKFDRNNSHSHVISILVQPVSISVFLLYLNLRTFECKAQKEDKLLHYFNPSSQHTVITLVKVYVCFSEKWRVFVITLYYKMWIYNPFSLFLCDQKFFMKSGRICCMKYSEVWPSSIEWIKNDPMSNGVPFSVAILSFFHVHMVFTFVLVYIFTIYNLDV
jgi:hypothetical protein